MAHLSEKQLAEEIGDKFNELAVYHAREKIQNLSEDLRVAEERGDEGAINATLQAISAVQQAQKMAHFAPEDFLKKD